MRYLITVLLALVSLSVFAQPGGDTDEFLQALAPIKSLQGDFVQRQTGEDGAPALESSGHFRLLRPGYFSWEIVAPDSQLIIASPLFLWQYDRDLETVTRRPVDASADMTPLQILGGDEKLLRERFQIKRAGVDAFTLTPVSEDLGFRKLTLRLNGPQLTGMDIEDKLGNSIAIEFTALDSSTVLSAADFTFHPPAGADLFYYDE